MDPERSPITSTPFPNALLDRWLPVLSDTEWRVLCVVVRQTLGWGKERDWLSQAQLKAKTGRHSAAISAAISGLVRRGLIEVVGDNRQDLSTSSERRSGGRRLWFGLRPIGLQKGHDPAPKPDTPAPTDSESGMSCSESEVRNPNTTNTSSYNIKSDSIRREQVLADLVWDEEHRFQARQLLAAYQDAVWRATGTVPEVVWSHDEPIMLGLLRRYSAECIRTLLRAFTDTPSRLRGGVAAFATFVQGYGAPPSAGRSAKPPNLV